MGVGKCRGLKKYRKNKKEKVNEKKNKLKKLLTIYETNISNSLTALFVTASS